MKTLQDLLSVLLILCLNLPCSPALELECCPQSLEQIVITETTDKKIIHTFENIKGVSGPWSVVGASVVNHTDPDRLPVDVSDHFQIPDGLHLMIRLRMDFESFAEKESMTPSVVELSLTCSDLLNSTRQQVSHKLKMLINVEAVSEYPPELLTGEIRVREDMTLAEKDTKSIIDMSSVIRDKDVSRVEMDAEGNKVPVNDIRNITMKTCKAEDLKGAIDATGTFDIDPGRPWGLRLLKVLDVETTPKYAMCIHAEDDGNNTLETQVTIKVLGVDDNRLVIRYHGCTEDEELCETRRFTACIDPYHTGDVLDMKPGLIEVLDKNKGDPVHIEFLEEAWPPFAKKLVTINSTTGVISVVKNPETEEREDIVSMSYGSLHFSVQARVTGSKSKSSGQKAEVSKVSDVTLYVRHRGYHQLCLPDVLDEKAALYLLLCIVFLVLFVFVLALAIGLYCAPNKFQKVSRPSQWGKDIHSTSVDGRGKISEIPVRTPESMDSGMGGAFRGVFGQSRASTQTFRSLGANSVPTVSRKSGSRVL